MAEAGQNKVTRCSIRATVDRIIGGKIEEIRDEFAVVNSPPVAATVDTWL